MDDYRTVSPFSNYLPTDLFSGFVGRQAELADIRRAFKNGACGVLIVGPAGAGKTSLAQIFAKQSQEEFPGGVFVSSASWAEAPEHLLERAVGVPPKDAALLVVDDAEAFDDAALRLLQDVLQQHPRLRVVLTSRRSLGLERNFHTIRLAGLSRREFRELLQLRHAFAQGQLDEQLVERLFQLAGGNALLASLASEAVRSGAVASWQELFQYLRGFRTPGLIGPDGRPLTKDSERTKGTRSFFGGVSVRGGKGERHASEERT